MKVSVSGYQFTFPRKCACCTAPADAELPISSSKFTGKRVVHSNTKVWDVPYCTRCLNHIKALSEAAKLAKGLTVLSLVVAVVLCFLTATYIGVPVGVLGFVGAMVLRKQKIAEARSMCGPQCASADTAIFYLGWYGTLHQFEMSSLDFAHEFMLANQRKLVNLTPEAQQLLASTGVIPKPDAPRSARRYMI